MANKNGIILEHRLVMAEHLGRYLTKDEIVHHLDGDMTNNDVSNLVITVREKHNSYHPKTKKYVTLVCSYCGKEFERAANLVGYNPNQKQVYCGRKCMGYDSWKRRKEFAEFA